jgi:hypothetical protein
VRKGLLLGLTLLALGCAGVRPVPFDDPPDAPVRFLRYRVVHRAMDHLALEILYTYDGSQGAEGVFVGAVTTAGPGSAANWAYRPDPLVPGTHWARVRLGLGPSAPFVHRTAGIEFRMYRGGGSTFHEAAVPFRKTWIRLPAWLEGHRRWGAGCGGEGP